MQGAGISYTWQSILKGVEVLLKEHVSPNLILVFVNNAISINLVFRSLVGFIHSMHRYWNTLCVALNSYFYSSKGSIYDGL
jgi:hypothetical protein